MTLALTANRGRPSARASALAIVAAVLSASSAALAQDMGDLESMLDQEVVTSASKSAESSRAAPATAMTITSADLRRHGIRTIADALEFLAPAITTSDPSQNVDLGARGVTLPFDRSAHVLVLLDGHALNEELSGGVNIGPELGMPIDMVDHIEVILGPGSVLYGTNAMLGVVNIVSKKARDYAGVHAGAASEIGASYQGHAGIGARVDALGEDGGVAVGIQHFRRHDPLEIDRVYVGNDAYTGLPLRTRADGSDNGYWGGTWYHNDLDATSAFARLDAGAWRVMARGTLWNRSDPAMLFDFDNPDQNEPVKDTSVDVKYAAPVSKLMDLQARLYGDYQTHDFDYVSSAAQYCLPGQTNGCHQTLKGGSEWAGLELQSRFDWIGDGSQQTLLGVDGRVRNAAFVSDITDAVTGDNPGSTSFFSGVDQNVGIYAQHVAALHRTTTLNLGVRFDADSAFGIALSPRAAAIFTPFDTTTIKAILSTAFRAPTPVEQSFSSPFLFVKADDLKPERVRSGELNIAQAIGSHVVSTSIFYSRWDDMVVLQQLSPAELRQAKLDGELLAFLRQGFQYRNAAAIEDFGLTLGLSGSMVQRKLQYGISGTSAYVRQKLPDGTSRLLAGAGSRFAKARVSYDLGGGLPTLALATLAAAPIPIAGLDEGGYPTEQFTPFQVTTRFNVTGPVPALKGLDYQLGVQFANSAEGERAVSPIKHQTPEAPRPTVVDNHRFRAFVGLEYHLGF